jgi:hypothetical protein
MGSCRFGSGTSHEQRNHQLLTNPLLNFKQPKPRAEMVFQKWSSSSEMESCGGGQVPEMPRVPKSARVRGLQRIDSAVASLPLVVKSDKDGVSCLVKCAGQEIGQEEGGPEPGPDVCNRPSRNRGREAV